MENRRRIIKKNLAEKITSLSSHVKIDEPLKEHTTFHLGGPAKYFISVRSIEELSRLYALSRKEKIPFLVLGSGSNILFSDRGFDGIVVRLEGVFSEFRFDGIVLQAGAGAHLGAIVNGCTEKGLAGFECLAGIPGTIGGALMSNAGTRDEWIGDRIASVEVMQETGTVKTHEKSEIEFSYRHSNLEKMLVTAAVVNLKKGSKNDIVKKIEERLLRRSESQPTGTWNAGSVFRNPLHENAGKLIESCGLKGFVLGGARVSEKHANFIVNTGSATSDDVRSLITLVRNRVREKHNIDLTLEIKVID